MSLKTIIIKNVDTVDHTYAGQLIVAGEEHTVGDKTEQGKLAYSALLNQHIWDSTPKAIINDGVNDLDATRGDKYIKDIELGEPDGRIVVHQTSRKRGLITYFTGCGDDEMDETNIGSGGQMINAHHLATDMMTQSYTVYFNTIENETHMHEGYLQWKDALNDRMTMEFVPKTTATSAGTNTMYNLYGGYLVVPAAGDGTLDINNMDRVLVGVPLNEEGVQAGAGYWDADWNYTTKEFENITANGSGTGKYNMFTVAVTLERFVNKICMLGSGFIHLSTSDSSMVGHNMGVKFTLAIMGTNHDMWWNSSLTLHRRKTN